MRSNRPFCGRPRLPGNWNGLDSLALPCRSSESRGAAPMHYLSSRFFLALAATVALAILAGRADAQSRSTGGAGTPARPSTAPQLAPIPAPSTPTAPPSSVIGTPAPQAPGIAPLSPQQPSNFSSGGGVPKGRNSMALSPGSPSETAPSAPGGGGKTLSDCMGFWDAGTHMTKQEWRAACKRTLNRIQ